MRDLKKLKECVVIKLDKSQLGILLLGTVLVTAGTFSAGVVVGRRGEVSFVVQGI